MSLLWADSFQADRTATSLGRRYIATGWPATISDNGGRRPGYKALTFFAQDGTSAILNASPIAPVSDYLLCGFGVRAQNPNTEEFFRVRRSGAKQCWVAIEDPGADGYRLSLYDGTGTRLYQSEKIQDDRWVFVELEANITPVTVLGEYKFRLNGITVAEGNANLAETGASGWNGLHFTFNPDPDDPLNYVSIADFYATDAADGWTKGRFLGPGVRIETIRPKSSGAATDWSVTGAGNNYDAVDDAGAGTPTVDDDATYVSTSDPTDLDLYEFTKPIESQHGVVGVEIEEDVRHEGVADTIRPVAHLEGYAVEIAEIDIPGSTYSRQRFVRELDPLKTGAPGAFTHERLSATQWGHGDPASITQAPSQYNVVLLCIDDPTLDCLSTFADINPYREDWTDGEGFKSGTGDNPYTSKIYIQDTFLQFLAGSGVTFLDAHANPTCSPSRANILTGRYSFDHGTGAVIRDDLCTIGSYYEFGDFTVTVMAELLNAAGKTTGMVGKWHLALDEGEDTVPPSGFSGYGWDHVPDVGQWQYWRCGHFRNLNQTPAPSGSSALRSYYHWRINRQGSVTDYTDASSQGWTNPAVEPNYATSIQFDDAADLANTMQEPFCLVVNTNAVHGPFNQAPPSLVETTDYHHAWPGIGWKNALGMFEAWNTCAWQFWEQLDPARRERTVFIVTGDNGTDAAVMQSLATQFDVGPTYDALNSIGRFKGQVYERGTQIPLIIAGPVVDNPGRKSWAMMHVVDILPTVLDIMGVPFASEDFHGISLMPILRDAVNEIGHARQHVFTEAFMPNGSPLETYTFPAEWSSSSVSYTLGQLTYWNQAEYECVQSHTSNASREPGTTGGNAYWSYERGLQLDRSLKARLSGFTSPGDGTANGVFKLVSIRGQPDELYRIKDENGIRWDPFELNPLNQTTYAAQKAELERIRQELVTGGGSGSLRLPVYDDATGLTLRCPLNEAEQLSVELDSGGSLLVQSTSNQIVADVDGGSDLTIDLEGVVTGDYALECLVDSGGTLVAALDGSGNLQVTVDSGGSLSVAQSGDGQIAVENDSTGGSLLVTLLPV